MYIYHHLPSLHNLVRLLKAYRYIKNSQNLLRRLLDVRSWWSNAVTYRREPWNIRRVLLHTAKL